MFTKHARVKLMVLKRHKFPVTVKQVRDALRNPDQIDYSRLPLFVAQKSIDAKHVLRVVYREEADKRIIITFYPGRKTQYEKR